MIRFLPLATATLALGACTARETAHVPMPVPAAPRYVNLDAALDAPGAAGRPRPERIATPVAVLPDWIGRPVRLRERDDAAAFEQVVSLDRAPKADRENLVLLTQPRSPAAAEPIAGAPAPMGGRPTEAGIRAELESVFPEVAMQIVTRPAANAYGPYGLAIGRNARGARCLYAWQWIEEAPAIEDGQAAPRSLSLRVRLCRDDITLEAMAASVNQLTLVPRFSGEPVARAATTRPHAPPRHRVRAPGVVQSPPSRRVKPLRQVGPVAEAVPERTGRRYLGIPASAPEAAGSTPVSSGGDARRAGRPRRTGPDPTAGDGRR